jgi:phosphate-selective porin OprO/OprP
MRKFVLATAVATTLLRHSAAYADTTAAPSDIEALREAINKQQVELDAQKKQLEALQAAKVSTQDAPRWSMPYNRPTITSSDGRSSLAVRMIVQGDYAHYVQDSAGTLATDFRRGSVGTTPNRENNAARDLSDGFYFRRARIGIEGTVNRDFNYRLIMELGGSGTEGPTRINDAWVNYTGFAPFTIQFGAGAPPANLDDSTTPEDGLFIERASPSDLSRSLAGADGRTHFSIKGSGGRWFSALTLTGRTVNDAEVNDSQSAVIGRFAALATTSANYNIHVGASGTYVIHPSDAGIDATGARYGIRFRNQPELRVDSTRLVDTGSIDADHAYAIGAEFAANWRSLFLQAENFWYGIERRNSTLPDPSFEGYYVEGSWLLTGESHRYNMATASFQNPRPFVNASSQGGWGAWELALRYSHTDLNSHDGSFGLATPAGGVRGGVQNIITFGANWYLNSNLKLVFNYLHTHADRLNPSTTAFGASPASPPIGAQIGQTLKAYALRLQYSL